MNYQDRHTQNIASNADITMTAAKSYISPPRISLTLCKACVLDLQEGDVGLHTPHAFDPRKLFALKTSQSWKVFCNNAQQEITISREDMRFRHLWKFPDFLDEMLGLPLVFSRQPYPDKSRHPEPGFCRIHNGDIPLDNAAFFQHPHTAQAWRWREPDAPRKFIVGTAAIFLENTKNTPINRIQFHWYIISWMNILAQSYAKY